MTNFSRNNKTNALLATIYDLLTKPREEALIVPVTLGVNGLLVTGDLISADEFFDLEQNSPYAPFYENVIKKDELKYFDENGQLLEDISENEVPDYIWQRFIYLKNARYISGGNFIPSAENEGVSIQIRVSDISTINLSSFTSTRVSNKK
ncbi:TPA: hypothetical protein MW129_003437 [Acinetobacter baumannii]|nr:hypothetical protein [Acinetobacter baumannii]